MYKGLRRDGKVAYECITQTDDGNYIFNRPVKIVVPDFYFNGGRLGSIEDTVSVIGIFAIIYGDRFSVQSQPNIFTFRPDDTSYVTFEGDKYFELMFDAGSMFLQGGALPKDNAHGFTIYNEFVAKGYRPWFMGYMDECDIFENFDAYLGVNLETDYNIEAGFTANRARNKKDLSKYARESYKTHEEMVYNDDVTIIPLRSTEFGVSNANARMTGSGFQKGLEASLVNQTKESQVIETIMRS